MRVEQIKPTEDHVLVRVMPAENTVGSSFKLILPETVQHAVERGKGQKPYRGVVVAVGPGRVLPNGDLRVPEVKPNDVVLFDYYTGQDRVTGTDDGLVLLKEEDVQVVL